MTGRARVNRVWLRLGYRHWARLLHRFNLHHTRTLGPLEPGGGYFDRCEWCGLSSMVRDRATR